MTAYWRVEAIKINLTLETNFIHSLKISAENWFLCWKRPKNHFSALLSKDINFRNFILTKYALNTHTQILSALLRILKNLFWIRRLRGEGGAVNNESPPAWIRLTKNRTKLTRVPINLLTQLMLCNIIPCSIILPLLFTNISLFTFSYCFLYDTKNIYRNVNNICILECYFTNISHKLFGHKITFVNSQHNNTNSKGDFLLKNRV